MTERIGNLLALVPEGHRECSACHQVAECRPYGKGGADLCYRCGMSPEHKAVVDANFAARLDGVEPPPIITK